MKSTCLQRVRPLFGEALSQCAQVHPLGRFEFSFEGFGSAREFTKRHAAFIRSKDAKELSSNLTVSVLALTMISYRRMTK